MPNAGREDSGGGEFGVGRAAEATAISSVATANEPHEFDRQFQLINQDGHPLDDVPIHLITPKSQNGKSKTDALGKSSLVSGSKDEDAVLVLFQDEGE